MVAKRYKHSVVFAQYKAIHEDIQDNLTSLEYLQILDYLFKKAWAPVVALCPVFMRNYVAKVLSYQNGHSPTKVCSESKDALNFLAFNFLCAQDTRSSVQAFENLHLNRGVIAGVLTRFVALGDEYIELWSPFNTTISQQEKAFRALSIENKLCLTKKQKAKFFTVYKHVKYWLERALEFRAKILQKYVRMSLLQAKRAYEDYHHIVDLDDISSIFINTVGKAIDRCDSRLGVLTTFIQNWLQSARGEVLDIVNSVTPCTSYEEIVEETQEGYISPELSSPVSSFVSKPNTSYENVQYIAYQAKKVDTDGVLRVILGIPETLSLTEQKFLLKFV